MRRRIENAMRIGEVAELTGLTISNIRFYEKKGLIEPEREQQSKYREYTEADVKRLKQIILYRKMDLSIEMICQILEGHISVQDALEQQLLDLKEQQKALQGAIDLCEKVVLDQAYEEMDVESYLKYVKEEEANGARFAQIEELLTDFADFTQMNRMIGDPYVGWMFTKPWLNRLVAISWMLMLIAIPVLCIIDDYLDGNGMRPVTFWFWLCWLAFFGINFWQYRKQKKR